MVSIWRRQCDQCEWPSRTTAVLGVHCSIVEYSIVSGITDILRERKDQVGYAEDQIYRNLGIFFINVQYVQYVHNVQYVRVDVGAV